MSAPITNVTFGKMRDFSRKVGARVSSTVARPANWSRRRRTSAAVSAGLSTLSTDSSKWMGVPEDLRRRLRQANVSVVPRVERAGHDRGGQGGPQPELAVRAHGDPLDRTRQKLVERRDRRQRGVGAALAGRQQARRRGRGDVAAACQAQRDGAGHEIFLAGPVAPALFEDDGGQICCRGRRHGDVTAMVAVLRTIAREACRGAEPDRHPVRLSQGRGAPARALGHGDGGLPAAGLFRICPEVVPERARVIGNDGFEQEA